MPAKSLVACWEKFSRSNPIIPLCCILKNENTRPYVYNRGGFISGLALARLYNFMRELHVPFSHLAIGLFAGTLDEVFLG